MTGKRVGSVKVRYVFVDLLIVFWFVRQAIEFIFEYMGNSQISPYVNIVVTVFTYATSVAGIVVSLRKELVKEVFFIATGLIILLACNYMIYPENISSIQTVARMTVTTLPCYILVRSIPNALRIISVMDYISCLIIPAVAYIQAAGLNQAVDNYLIVSYSILPCMIVLIGLLYQQFRFRRVICVIIGCLTLMIYGGRLPLLLLVLSILLFELKAYTKNKKQIKTLLKYIVCSVMILIVALNISNIKSFVLQKYESQNTYSRILTRIFEADLFDLSGRDDLFKSSIKLIRKNPVLGNGIGSDTTMIIKERLYTPDYVLSNGGGLSVHNGILEFAMEFGLIALAAAVSLLWRICVCAFKQVNYGYDFIFLVLLLGVGIFRTIFGYPYWYNHAFWMGIAWCVTIYKQCHARQTARADSKEE